MDIEEWQMALVHPIDGEPMRFRVDSETDPGVSYVVNLGALRVRQRMNGQCECDNFKFKRLPNLRMFRKPTARSRCKHIKWAMAYVMEMMLPKLATEFRTDEKERRRERPLPPQQTNTNTRNVRNYALRPELKMPDRTASRGYPVPGVQREPDDQVS
jgi:hypothetical protein